LQQRSLQQKNATTDLVSKVILAVKAAAVVSGRQVSQWRAAPAPAADGPCIPRATKIVRSLRSFQSRSVADMRMPCMYAVQLPVLHLADTPQRQSGTHTQPAESARRAPD